MSVKTWLLHLKIQLVGDKELETKGKILPCKKCDKPFFSYCHYGDFSYVYDSVCPDC